MTPIRICTHATDLLTVLMLRDRSCARVQMVLLVMDTTSVPVRSEIIHLFFPSLIIIMMAISFKLKLKALIISLGGFTTSLFTSSFFKTLSFLNKNMYYQPLNLFVHIDNNECMLGTHDCDNVAACQNTVGSFNCQCPTGYFGDGKTCTGMLNIFILRII